MIYYTILDIKHKLLNYPSQLKRKQQQISFNEIRKQSDIFKKDTILYVNKLKKIEFTPKSLFEEGGIEIARLIASTEEIKCEFDYLLEKDKDKVNKTNLILLRSIVGQFIFIAIIFILFGLDFFKKLVALDFSGNDINKYIIPIIRIPWIVVIWSYIGSLGAMTYKYNKKQVKNYGNAIKWTITRPIQGIILASALYLVIKSGQYLVSNSSENNGIIFSEEIMMFISFLVGFSDRFADKVFTTLVDKYMMKTSKGNF